MSRFVPLAGRGSSLAAVLSRQLTVAAASRSGPVRKYVNDSPIS